MSIRNSSSKAGAGGIGSKRLATEELENDAREAKKGLWVDPSPIPPLVYRKARRGQSLDLLDMVPLESGASPRAPPLFGAVESDSVSPRAFSSPYPVIGNRRSHIYH